MPYNEFGETPEMAEERRLSAWVVLGLILGIPLGVILTAAFAIIVALAV